MLLQISLTTLLFLNCVVGTPPPGYQKKPEEPDEHPPKYEYGYKIADEKGVQGKVETRDGIYALGRYFVQGTEASQHVRYFADDWGYHPYVEYSNIGPHSRSRTQIALGAEAVKTYHNLNKEFEPAQLTAQFEKLENRVNHKDNPNGLLITSLHDQKSTQQVYQANSGSAYNVVSQLAVPQTTFVNLPSQEASVNTGYTVGQNFIQIQDQPHVPQQQVAQLQLIQLNEEQNSANNDQEQATALQSTSQAEQQIQEQQNVTHNEQNTFDQQQLFRQDTAPQFLEQKTSYIVQPQQQQLVAQDAQVEQQLQEQKLAYIAQQQQLVRQNAQAEQQHQEQENKLQNVNVIETKSETGQKAAEQYENQIAGNNVYYLQQQQGGQIYNLPQSPQYVQISQQLPLHINQQLISQVQQQGLPNTYEVKEETTENLLVNAVQQSNDERNQLQAKNVASQITVEARQEQDVKEENKNEQNLSLISEQQQKLSNSQTEALIQQAQSNEQNNIQETLKDIDNNNQALVAKVSEEANKNINEKGIEQQSINLQYQQLQYIPQQQVVLEQQQILAGNQQAPPILLDANNAQPVAHPIVYQQNTLLQQTQIPEQSLALKSEYTAQQSREEFDFKAEQQQIIQGNQQAANTAGQNRQPILLDANNAQPVALPIVYQQNTLVQQTQIPEQSLESKTEYAAQQQSREEFDFKAEQQQIIQGNQQAIHAAGQNSQQLLFVPNSAQQNALVEQTQAQESKQIFDGSPNGQRVLFIPNNAPEALPFVYQQHALAQQIQEPGQNFEVKIEQIDAVKEQQQQSNLQEIKHLLNNEKIVQAKEVIQQNQQVIVQNIPQQYVQIKIQEPAGGYQQITHDVNQNIELQTQVNYENQFNTRQPTIVRNNNVKYHAQIKTKKDYVEKENLEENQYLTSQQVLLNTNEKGIDESVLALEQLSGYGSKIGSKPQTNHGSSRLIDTTRNLVTGQDVLNINAIQHYAANVEASTINSISADYGPLQSFTSVEAGYIQEAQRAKNSNNKEYGISSTPATSELEERQQLSLSKQSIFVEDVVSTSERTVETNNLPEQYVSQNVAVEVTPRPVSTQFLAPITAGVQLQSLEQPRQNVYVEIQKSVPYYLGKLEYIQNADGTESVTRQNSISKSAFENIQIGKTLLRYPQANVPSTEEEEVAKAEDTLNHNCTDNPEVQKATKEDIKVEQLPQPQQLVSFGGSGNEQQYFLQNQHATEVDQVSEQHVQIPVPVLQPFPKIIQTTKYIDRPYPVPVQVHIPVPYGVEKTVEKIVDRPVTVTKFIERPVHIPQPYLVEKVVEKHVEVPVEVTKYVDRPYAVQVPVPVEKQVSPYVNNLPDSAVANADEAYPVSVKVPVPVSPGQKSVYHSLQAQIPQFIDKAVNKPFSVYYKSNDKIQQTTYPSQYMYAPHYHPNAQCDEQGSHSTKHYQTISADDYIGLTPPKAPTKRQTESRVRTHRHARQEEFGKNLRIEYGFMPPLIPSIEIDENGKPIERTE